MSLLSSITDTFKGAIKVISMPVKAESSVVSKPVIAVGQTISKPIFQHLPPPKKPSNQTSNSFLPSAEIMMIVGVAGVAGFVAYKKLL